MLGRRTYLTATDWLFWLLFVVGLGLHVAGGLHGNLWFDESYSVALARHPLPELLSIARQDVHPPFYYLMLRLVALVSGSSITAERLFSVCGTALLAALGWTHVRRDTSEHTALIYLVLVLFNPWSFTEAIDIRMYSWAAVFVMLSWVYVARLAHTLVLATPTAAPATEPATEPATALAPSEVPRHWWLCAFTFALLAAYTHYIAAMAATVAMLVLLMSCYVFELRGFIAKKGDKGHKSDKSYKLQGTTPQVRGLHAVFAHPCALFVLGSLVCGLAYVPWLGAARAQQHEVSNSFWITLFWPQDYPRLFEFPWLSDELEQVSSGALGPVLAQVVSAAVFALAFVLLALVLWALGRVLRHFMQARNNLAQAAAADKRRELAQLVVFGLGSVAVVWGCLLLAVLAGKAIGQPILVSRYLYVAVGPASLGMAVLLNALIGPAGQQPVGEQPAGRTQHAWCSPVARDLALACCVATAALGVGSGALAATRNYDPHNADAVRYYEQVTHDASGQTLPVFAAVPVWNSVQVAGPLAELVPAIKTQRMDSWYAAYEAFAPQATLVSDVTQDALSYHGTFVLLSRGANDGPVFSFAAATGSHIVSIRHFERSYKQENWCIAVLERP